MKTSRELLKTAVEFFGRYCTAEWNPVLQRYLTLIEVAKGEAFIVQGQPVVGLYLLIEGKVKVISHFYGSEDHLFRLANEMSFVGHRSLFRKQYTVSAVALEPCKLAFIPLNLLQSLLKANPEFSSYLLEFMMNELAESEEQQYMLKLDSVRQRVSYCLQKLLRTYGVESRTKKLTHTLSRKDIASMCNTTYESVVRTLSAFEKERIIKLEGRTIAITDPGALKAIALGKRP